MRVNSSRRLAWARLYDRGCLSMVVYPWIGVFLVASWYRCRATAV
jgi:hypothetical protein